jgi:hypothetical protein
MACTSRWRAVAFHATLAYFFALAQIVASHHVRPCRAVEVTAKRGNEMNAILTRVASAVIAMSLSSAVLSLAIV